MTDGPAIEIPTLEEDPVAAIAAARRRLFPMTLSQKPGVRQQTELFLSDATFMTTPIPVQGGCLDFFGPIQLVEQHAQAAFALPVSSDSLLLYGKDHEPIGVVYFARPNDPQALTATRECKPLKLRRDLTYMELKTDRVPEKEILDYYTALPAFLSEVTKEGHLQIAPQVAPRASLFYAWRYLRDHPERRKQVFALVQQKGVAALSTFLTGHGDEAFQAELIDFFLTEKDEPGHALADQLFSWLTEVNFDAMRVASHAVGRKLHEAVPLYKQIITLPQRLLAGIIAEERSYAHNPQLTTDQKARQRQIRADVLQAAQYYLGYLDLLAEPDDFGKPITQEELARFQKYHNPNNPNASAVFDAVAAYFFRVWGKRQQRFAPYAGRVAQITQAFYERLPHLETEASTLTADTELNREQIRGVVRTLFEKGILPMKPIAVRSDGVRSGRRIDASLYDYLTKDLGLQEVEYVGTDLARHRDLLPFITFVQGDATTALERYRNHFHLALTEWPGPPVDTLVLTDVLEYFNSISASLRPGGVYIVDVPLPYGRHSYAKEIAQAQAPGVIERSFVAPSGEKVSKPFLILDPESLIFAAHNAGLEVLNITPDPTQRQQLIDAISADDSVLTHREDSIRHACYQTESRYNRLRLVFVKSSPEDAEALRQKLGQITSPSSYGLNV